MKLGTRMLINKFRERAKSNSPARKYAGGAGVIRKGLAKELKQWRAKHGRKPVASAIQSMHKAPTKPSDFYKYPKAFKR